MTWTKHLAQTIQCAQTMVIAVWLLAFLIADSSSSVSAATLYFSTDAGPGTIQEYNTLNGSQSTFASGLANPLGLAFDSSGDLFVADGSSGNVYKYTRNGTRTTFASGLGYPIGVAVDASGNIYVGDVGNDKKGSGIIYKYSPGGARNAFASGLSQPDGLAFDVHGNLFEGDDFTGTINEFSSSGVKTAFATGFGNIDGFAFDSLGDLFMSQLSTPAIFEFTPTGVKSQFAPNSFLASPLGLAFDASGNLYVAEDVNTIVEYTPSGTQSTVPLSASAPRYLAFFPVPEPSSVVLFGLAAIGCPIVIRRFRQLAY